jgi:hypothetical protein
MALTIGAIVFLVGLVFLVYYGYSVGVKKNVKPGEENLQRCSLCTRKFNRSELVERVICAHRSCGSHKLSTDLDVWQSLGKPVYKLYYFPREFQRPIFKIIPFCPDSPELGHLNLSRVSCFVFRTLDLGSLEGGYFT